MSRSDPLQARKKKPKTKNTNLRETPTQLKLQQHRIAGVLLFSIQNQLRMPARRPRPFPGVGDPEVGEHKEFVCRNFAFGAALPLPPILPEHFCAVRDRPPRFASCNGLVITLLRLSGRISSATEAQEGEAVARELVQFFVTSVERLPSAPL